MKIKSYSEPLPMSLKCNDEYISHFTDPIKTLHLTRKDSLKCK